MLRREFIKMCGIAAVAPMGLLKSITTPKKNLDYEYEIEISLPSYIYNCKTGKVIELNLKNPAHFVIHILSLIGYTSYESEEFIEWGKYCDRNNLRVSNIEKYYDLIEVSLFEFLIDMSKCGKAIMIWDGSEKGQLRVIYGLPETTLMGRNIYLACCDDTFTVENINNA